MAFSIRIVAITFLGSFFISCRTNQLAVIKQSGKFGCIDRHGEIVIKPQWDFILLGDRHEKVLVEKDSLYGFLNRQGKTIISPKYRDANLFREGLAAVGNDKKYGFINPKGDTVIPFVYDDVGFGFSQGLSDVTRNDSCGYINKRGKVIIPLVYQNCYPFKSKYGQVEKFDIDYGLLIDKRRRIFRYDEVSPKIPLWRPRYSYPGGIETLTGRGRVNKKGDTVVPPIYSATANLVEHRYLVKLNNKWGVYSDKGVLIVEPKFDQLRVFSEGYAAYKLNGKFGYINKAGTVVIATIFDNAASFVNGLAYVELEGKAGYINKRGKFVIKPVFEPNLSSSGFR